MIFPSKYRGRRAKRKGETAPRSPAEFSLNLHYRERRAEVVTFGVCAAVASVGVIFATVGAVCTVLGPQPLVTGYLTGVAGLSTVFLVRGAVRSMQTILANTSADLLDISLLKAHVHTLTDRVWNAYDVSGAAKAAGESSGGSREGATLSPAANVYTINPRKPTRFQ